MVYRKLTSCISTKFLNEELKSLTRYRCDKVKERGQLKQSIARLVCILFPELEKLVQTLHMVSVYALLEEFPGAKQIAQAIVISTEGDADAVTVGLKRTYTFTSLSAFA